MADGRFPQVISKDRAPNAIGNGIYHYITDGVEIALVSPAGNLGVAELNSTAILADTAILSGAVTAGQMQVDIVAELPAGTQNIGDVDVVSIIPGVGATNLGKAVDAVAGASDVGVAMLGIRDDVLTTLTPADGDYVRPR